MPRSSALALLLVGLVRAEDPDQCSTAVTLRGLRADLDGDFQNAVEDFVNYQSSGRHLFLTRFVNVSDNRYQSPEEAQRHLGKWVVINGINGSPKCGYAWGHASCETFAVCEEGCPIFPGHLEHGLFNAAIWPAGTFITKWTVFGAGSERTVSSTVNGFCCTRKAQPCDGCMEKGICDGLWNKGDCPATGTHAKLYPLAAQCCESALAPPLDWPVCRCKADIFECDHSSDPTEVVTVV